MFPFPIGSVNMQQFGSKNKIKMKQENKMEVGRSQYGDRNKHEWKQEYTKKRKNRNEERKIRNRGTKKTETGKT